MYWKEFVLKIPSYRSSKVWLSILKSKYELWTALEKVEETLEELTAFYVEVGDEYGKKEAIEESETNEKEVQRAIEAGQTAIKNSRGQNR